MVLDTRVRTSTTMYAAAARRVLAATNDAELETSAHALVHALSGMRVEDARTQPRVADVNFFEARQND